MDNEPSRTHPANSGLDEHVNFDIYKSYYPIVQTTNQSFMSIEFL